MFRALCLSVVLAIGLSAFANNSPSKVLLGEYNRLHKMVQELEPEFEVGGVLKGVKINGVELLWDLASGPSDYDIIRIFVDHPTDPDKFFSVDYYRGTHLIDDHNVVRRFIEPSSSMWVNHTVDFETGEYFGSQGTSFLFLEDFEKKVLKDWGIQVLE